MTNTEASQIAATTRSQIGVMNLMACGARKFSYSADGQLTFKVGGRMRSIEITLDASDTYTVRLVRITRNYSRVVVEEHSDVYCDVLGQVVYGAVNK